MNNDALVVTLCLLKNAVLAVTLYPMNNVALAVTLYPMNKDALVVTLYPMNNVALVFTLYPLNNVVLVVTLYPLNSVVLAVASYASEEAIGAIVSHVITTELVRKVPTTDEVAHEKEEAEDSDDDGDVEQDVGRLPPIRLRFSRVVFGFGFGFRFVGSISNFRRFLSHVRLGRYEAATGKYIKLESSIHNKTSLEEHVKSKRLNNRNNRIPHTDALFAISSSGSRKNCTPVCQLKDDQTEENTFEILQHSDININNS